jgi:hypothetical protein
MKELASALPYVAFWAFMAWFVYLEHQQYMAGHETWLWTHKTPEEKRLQQAAVMKAEAEVQR